MLRGDKIYGHATTAMVHNADGTKIEFYYEFNRVDDRRSGGAEPVNKEYKFLLNSSSLMMGTPWRGKLQISRHVLTL